jgi:2,4-dienoyl-CoA reductase (NADPH2)
LRKTRKKEKKKMSASATLKRVLTPLKVGQTTLKNRIVMGSIHTGLEDDSKNFTKLGEFLATRARGGVGTIVTGGIAPSVEGWVSPMSGRMSDVRHSTRHRRITRAVHDADPDVKLLMQILHAGRYGYHPFAVAPSAIKAPIAPWFNYTRGLSSGGVWSQIDSFVMSAVLAQDAGYDGVEIMASEGYFLNEFLAPATNHRTDEFGGSLENRTRAPLEVVRRVRQAVGKDFIIMFRISLLDLVHDGQEWAEIVWLAQQLEVAGVDILNTGIGWHEARVPTIATSVPPAAFSFATERLKRDAMLTVPLCTSNRINRAEIAERVLSSGAIDLVSMARPMLADPDFVRKISTGEPTNGCIGCNQSCLDHVFVKKRASCLVNPRAVFELEKPLRKTEAPKKVLVVGGGPAGLACAVTLAQRGHSVVLAEASASLGGQFNMAKRVPGKSDFQMTIDYFSSMLKRLSVPVHLNTRVDVKFVQSNSFDSVVVATGVTPRRIRFDGDTHANVLAYTTLLQAPDKNRIPPNSNVAVIGAGGIGFDVSEYLTHEHHANDYDIDAFLALWGIDKQMKHRGALLPRNEQVSIKPVRNVTLLQRKAGKFGAELGKTTGWIHRAALDKHKVQKVADVQQYVRFDGKHLQVLVGPEKKEVLVPAEYVVVCAGQEKLNELYEALSAAKIDCKVIGGANDARGLDAARAIREATECADAM